MSNYKIQKNTIMTPGKLFGQPYWTAHFWEQASQGLADARERGAYIFDITKEDVDSFPELMYYDIVRLIEDRQGFVSAEAEYEDG